MSMRPLTNLTYKERRKQLTTEISKKSSGALKSTEVSLIVSQLNVNVPYQLELVFSYTEMRKRLLLKQSSPDDLTSYTFYTKEYGTILLGTASFGLLEDGLVVASPILEERQKLVILIDQHRFSSYNGICTKLGKKLTIVMYIP